jgi:outer membrane biogenesis lipoprotein LolB
VVPQKAHANMGSQSVKQRDRIPEAPVEKLLGINVNELPIVKWWIRGQTVQDADLGLASSETGEQFIHIN